MAGEWTRRVGWLATALVAGASFLGGAAAQGFDPQGYSHVVAGEPTRVLVLGTPHLSGLPDEWDAAMLDPLMDRLTAYDPDVITIENLPGHLIHRLWAYRESHPQVAVHFAGEIMAIADEAKRVVGMDMPEAQAAAEAMLRDWPDDPAPAQRRALTARLAAAGDAYSALVQWLRLPGDERVPGDGVSGGLADRLDALAIRRDESSLIAARLAARTSLERVFATDHQSTEGMTPAQAARFYEEVWPGHMERFRADPLMQELIGKNGEMTDGASTLEAYRFLNDPAVNQRQDDLSWGGLIARASPDDVSRRRLAGWEMRNLRMAASIREASATAPGGRVLVIVGAGHKNWLEHYLGMMADMAVVPAGEVLR